MSKIIERAQMIRNAAASGSLSYTQQLAEEAGLEQHNRTYHMQRAYTTQALQQRAFARLGLHNRNVLQFVEYALRSSLSDIEARREKRKASKARQSNTSS